MVKEFYSPREIKFTRAQCLWLIWHLSELREGYWPTDAAHYDLHIGKGTVQRKAYFEVPEDYAAEIEIRLERAGLDGLVLLCIECWEMGRESLGSYLGVSEWVIGRRRRRALTFVAGWRRKVK